ncbi:low molecular weight protein arginine phosphatase, partial [bacterium]|nr:low molecular weight protein arginine phosphatase [bacterium]
MKNPFRIVFICTGNYCRSPIAEALLKQRLQQTGLDTQADVVSAGTVALNGSPPSAGAQYAVRQMGATLDGFESMQLTEDICDNAHLLLVMEQDHREYIEDRFPAHAKKVVLLGEMLPQGNPLDIPDPIGAENN